MTASPPPTSPRTTHWVQTTLIDGVFGHDYFSEDASAYNIYRVNLESVDSEVSTRTYDEHGTPNDPSDDTIAAETIRNTALGMIFSGSWAHCWLEYGLQHRAADPGRDQHVGAGRQRDPRRAEQPQLRRLRWRRPRARADGRELGGDRARVRPRHRRRSPTSTPSPATTPAVSRVGST